MTGILQQICKQWQEFIDRVRQRNVLSIGYLQVALLRKVSCHPDSMYCRCMCKNYYCPICIKEKNVNWHPFYFRLQLYIKGSCKRTTLPLLQWILRIHPRREKQTILQKKNFETASRLRRVAIVTQNRKLAVVGTTMVS